jgi:bis(5'-nucleosyl)-tetraphosphatase (symmetrical)
MLTAAGHLDLSFTGSPWRARKGEMPWYNAKQPAWQGTRVVFGHWSVLGLIVLPDLISLDSGCVWGRQLTAVRIDTRMPRVMQVKGQGL